MGHLSTFFQGSFISLYSSQKFVKVFDIRKDDSIPLDSDTLSNSDVHLLNHEMLLIAVKEKDRLPGYGQEFPIRIHLKNLISK